MQSAPTVAWRLVFVALVTAIAVAGIVVVIVRRHAKKRVRGFPVEPRE